MKDKKIYSIWNSMKYRCNNVSTYENCDICDEWLIYDNFEKWYKENYYEVKGEKMSIDKDIICLTNSIDKIYSPNTCLILPQRINSLFINIDNLKMYSKSMSLEYKYQASISNRGRIITEHFDTKENAIIWYKFNKRLLIESVVNDYYNKGKLSKYAYEKINEFLEKTMFI